MRPDEGDYEYDQAHELEHGTVPAAGRPRPQHRSASPEMPAVEPDGDWSYDQAHDVGRH